LDLFKVRTTFSNAALNYINYISPLRKNQSAALIPSCKAVREKEPARGELKEKLELIEKKLKAARRQIEG
jgi:hypothetical protein